MDISFPQTSTFDFARQAVAFPAVVDGVQRRVLVSIEALVVHFGASVNDDFVAMFERNRGLIQAAAYDRLRQGDAGEVILKAAYF